MQMTYDQAMRPGPLMLFAARRGSGYMMRSEKRDGGYGSPSRKPPKRKRAGFFYIFITLLLSVILWPVGMVMLWQRKVRMTAGTKLVVSLLTLCLSVFLIVFALTVPLDNVEFTAFQDKANDWLDKAAADVAVAADATMKKTSETWQVMTDFAEAGAAYTGAYAADALDAGVEIAGKARLAIEDLIHRDEATPPPAELPGKTEAPEQTGEPKATDAAEATEVPEATDAAEATEVPEATDAAEATEVPEATAAVEATEASETAGASEPTGTPGAVEKGGKSAVVIVNAEKKTEAPEAEAPETEAPETEAPETEAPETEATETEAPETGATGTEAPGNEPSETVVVLLPEATPASEGAQPLGEGTLHANGEFEPGTVDTTAETPADAGVAEPLAEATAIPLKPVTAPPAEAASEAPTEAPVEAATEAPAAKALQAPGEALVPVTEAPAQGDAPTGASVIWNPVEAATEAPTEAPAEAPGEPPMQSVSHEYTVKPAGQATVYFFTNGSVGFHNGPNRHDMSGAPAHTLQEAFDLGKNPCKSCGMPERDILDEPHVAWVDANDRIHTTDECDAFKGQWRLMSLEQAIAAGYAPCDDCGADFYAEELFPAPTPTPEPQAVSPAVALKPVSEIRVYYYDSSKSYHSGPSCSGMNNAPAHSLAEAAVSGKGACRRCNPPAADLVGKAMLWQDADGVCHTSDTCAAFTGSYRLVLRDDALAQGLAACPDCGATDYLIPGTVLAGQ